MKRFMTENGPIDVAHFDGQSVGGRILEGVDFVCVVEQGKVVVTGVTPICSAYFEQLNKNMWLTKVQEAVKDNDVFQIPGNDEEDCWIEDDDVEVEKLECSQCGEDFIKDQRSFHKDYGTCIDCTDYSYLASHRGYNVEELCQHIIEQKTPWVEKAQKMLDDLS